MRPIVFTLLSFTPIHPHQHDLSVYHGLAGRLTPLALRTGFAR